MVGWKVLARCVVSSKIWIVRGVYSRIGITVSCQGAVIFVKNLCKLGFFFGLLLAFGPLFANHVDDLYSARLPVPSRSDVQRKQMLPKAIEQVLIKVSGNTDIAQVDKIKEVFSHPENYLDTYSYELIGKEGAEQLMLVASFDPQQVKSLLRHTGQTVWGEERPLTMVWMVVDDGKAREFIGSDSSRNIISDIEGLAQGRGLPVLFPLLDLQDLGQVSVNDVLAPFPWKVHQAAKRYGSEAELIGRISRIEDVANERFIWQGQWLLLLNGAKLNWQTKGETVSDVVAQVVNEVADAIGSQYAVSYHGGKNQQLSLAVYGVTSIERYTQVSSYLKSLSLVAQLDVNRIASDHVVYNLVVAGGAHHLASVLNDEQTLQPLEQGEVGGDRQATLSYRLAS